MEHLFSDGPLPCRGNAERKKPLRLMLGGVALGLSLALVAWLLILLGQLGQPHPGNQWMLEALTHKQQRAAAQTEPQLVIAGGSSAMFGVDSQQLGQAFGRPAVNLGVNAGLGLPVILNQTLASVKAGDVVILVLEYPLFSYSGKINHVMNDFYLSQPGTLLAAWQLSYQALPLYRWLPLVVREAFQVVMQTSAKRVWQGYRGLPAGFSVAGTYGAHRLDAYGDQTQTLRQFREPWMAQQVVADVPRHYGADHHRNAPGWALLDYFQAQLHVREACLVVVPPAFLFHPYYREDPAERRFYETLPEQAGEHGLVYRGRPYDFMYPAKDMFDTDFHLVDEARSRNTQQLIKALTSPDKASEPVIECSRPTI